MAKPDNEVSGIAVPETPGRYWCRGVLPGTGPADIAPLHYKTGVFTEIKVKR